MKRGEQHHIIGRDGSVYLDRFCLASAFGVSIYLHVFQRGDEDPVLHDHPGDFVSFIVAGGYVEETAAGRTWQRAGTLLFRRASHAHRILLDDRKAVSIVIFGRSYREWGFIDAGRWIPWRTYLGDRA